MTTATPRTDAAIELYGDRPFMVSAVPVEFAEGLERELAASKAEIKELKESAERIGTNRYEQLKKAEAEVAFWKSKAYEAEQSEGKHEAEVERLRSILKDHATFMRKNGFDYQANLLDLK